MTNYLGDVGSRAVKLWTSDAVYATINKGLLEDDKDILENFMIYINALNFYIKKHPSPENYTTYRGSKAKPVDLSSKFVPGQMFVANKFTCTSLSLQEAKNFLNIKL